MLKFCPLLGAVKIFMLMGVDPPPPRLHEYGNDHPPVNSMKCFKELLGTEKSM